MPRAKGTRNKRTLQVRDLLERLDCNPVEQTALMALGDVPCPMCGGTGKTKHKRPRACSACEGHGREYVPMEIRASMRRALLPYFAPKLKSIEHTGPGGAPIQVRHSGVLKVPGMLSPEEWAKAAEGHADD